MVSKKGLKPRLKVGQFQYAQLAKKKLRKRKGSHTVTRMAVHVVWVTKYRYKVMRGDIQKRCRALIRQDCETLELEILKGW